MTKLIILDRDGVINHDSPGYIKSPEEFHPLPRSLEAIAHLNTLGFTVVVASNQSGIARGLYDLKTLDAMHTKLHNLLAEVHGKVATIYYCPHMPDEGCHCRKPNPGMLEDIARDFKMDLNGVFFVGDTYRDIQAARAVGACPILVKTGKGQATLDAHSLEGIPVFDDLYAFATSL